MPNESTLQPESNVSTLSTEAIAAKAAGKDFSTSEYIYDPQKRTPIKRPVEEICPHCGQIMPKKVKAVLTHMSQYVNEKGAMVAVSSAEDILEIKGVKYYKVTEEKLDPETKQFVYKSKFMSTVKK